MKTPGNKAMTNIGLALVIALSVYLIWNMVSYMRSGKEKFEGVYAPAEFYAELVDSEPYAELVDLEHYDQLEDVDETFAPLGSEDAVTKWGDGSSIGTGAPMPTFTPLLLETAHVSDDANGLFSL